MSSDDLQYLLDRLAISDLLTTYAHAVDTRDWELFRSVFTEDATIDYTNAGGIAGTVTDVTDWLGRTMEMFAATQHLVSNELVTIDGDTATVRALFYNPMRFANDGPFFHCGGWYNHELVRTDEGWRSRRLHEDHSWTQIETAEE